VRLNIKGFIDDFSVMDTNPNNVVKAVEKDDKGVMIPEGYNTSYKYNEDGYLIEDSTELEEDKWNFGMVIYEYSCR
jgi:hypothetical protein